MAKRRSGKTNGGLWNNVVSVGPFNGTSGGCKALRMRSSAALRARPSVRRMVVILVQNFGMEEGSEERTTQSAKPICSVVEVIISGDASVDLASPLIARSSA